MNYEENSKVEGHHVPEIAAISVSVGVIKDYYSTCIKDYEFTPEQIFDHKHITEWMIVWVLILKEE